MAPEQRGASRPKRATAVLKEAAGSGARLRVRYSDGQIYDAVVVDEKAEAVLVHYLGWRSRFDEWIDRGSDKLLASQPPVAQAWGKQLPGGSSRKALKL